MPNQSVGVNHKDKTVTAWRRSDKDSLSMTRDMVVIS